MKRVVVDASALAAIAFNEPAGAGLAERLHGCRVTAPHLLRYELANVAWKKIRRDPSKSVQVAAALADALRDDNGVACMDVDPVDVLLIAAETGLTAYDASYIYLAGVLGADLVTLDDRLASAVQD